MTLDNVSKELRTALESLRAEHARINEHIASIESVLAKMGAPVKRGPGRPPKALSASSPAPAAKRGGGGGTRKRPKWSAEAREAARKRMQDYWAKRRKNG
ncbi:MAG: hypothetical protein U1E65_00560 [Myxococcota bacterium]